MISNYNEITEKLKDINWKEIIIIFTISKGSIGYDKIEYIDDHGITIFFFG